MKLLTAKKKVDKLINTTPPEEEIRTAHKHALENLQLLVENQRVATPTFAFKAKDKTYITANVSSKDQLAKIIASIEEG